MKDAVLLFAHGARDPLWALPFRSLAQRVAALRPDAQVQLAFLEFMTPTLIDAGHELAGAGCTRVQVVPVFLGTGGHVRRDLPELIESLRAQHPQVLWRLCSALGERDSVIDALAREAVRDINEAPI